ncbi:hypothetical protein A1F94_009784 [Pyrenophora tritici-repentis]|nr:hypothetical protein A1F94_009784 [Pyrenophora tritici-repentis]PZD42516.1 hypothetical protein A1F97_03526 [Pyrenophora tritici-repentis]
MATVTIGKSYFEALLRRAEFVSRIQDTSCAPGLHGEADFHRQHTSNQHVNYGTDLSNNVTISKAEHEFMIQAVREYHLLKSALFRGGLSAETLETLLQGENGATSEAPSIYDYDSEHITARSGAGTGVGNASTRYMQGSDNTAVSYGLQSKACPQSVPRRTTHKDLASIVRGGRLLDIFLRNDRSATISFVEGAAEFLAYAKRNDIYLHMKRLEFRWNDRQFHVPPHVSNKIANGATRNLVVRCIAGKVTADQIRDHLDHIHNLVVVDIYFQKGDAYISTNSVHNALFARTCMMSRTTYKGTRIEYYPDECAEALPRPTKTQNPVSRAPVKPMPVVNQYALLDTGSDDDSQSDEESYMTNGVKVDGYHWADSVVA